MLPCNNTRRKEQRKLAVIEASQSLQWVFGKGLFTVFNGSMQSTLRPFWGYHLPFRA